jgi:ferrochelatase
MDAVLLVGHGTVEDLDDLPSFLLRIRRGRPSDAALLAEIRRRYEAIGGSPLLEMTRKQARSLESRLGMPVFVAMRMWRPFIEDVLAEACDRGVGRLCILPMAPFSVHVYAAATRAALEASSPLRDRAPELVAVEPWGTEPALVRAHAAAIAPHLEVDPLAALVVTAHSLPTASIRSGDPYRDQFEACARAVFDELRRSGTVAFQSQGADGGDWIGPDLRTVLSHVERAGERRVVLAPIGFLADHVETLYDLDVEARDWARELGLDLQRVPALNDDPGLVEAMASAAGRALSLPR